MNSLVSCFFSYLLICWVFLFDGTGGGGRFLVTAFQPVVVIGGRTRIAGRRRTSGIKEMSRATPTSLQEKTTTTSGVEEYLSENYPMFMTMIMSKNDDVWKKLIEDSPTGYTIFAPIDSAFDELGEKRCQQLKDDRNGEVVENIARYHAINEPVSESQLRDAGGIITLGGELPIEPMKEGGFFGIGGKDSGGVTVNGARVLKTVQVGDDCTLHEVDKLISPSLLWRYLDQLRIPLSK